MEKILETLEKEFNKRAFRPYGEGNVITVGDAMSIIEDVVLPELSNEYERGFSNGAEVARPQ